MSITPPIENLEKVPCINCITLSMCKWKNYGSLMDCQMFYNYLYMGRMYIPNEEFTARMHSILKVFSPRSSMFTVVKEFVNVDQTK